MPFYVYHPGTGTYMDLDECVIHYVDASIEDVEEYLDNKHAIVY